MQHPIFVKVQEAVEVVALSRQLKQGAISPTSVLLTGTGDSHLHVSYQQATGGVILAFVAHDDWDQIAKDRFSGRTVPSWSPDKNIKVHKNMLGHVDSFIKARAASASSGKGAGAPASGMAQAPTAAAYKAAADVTAVSQPSLLDIMIFLAGGYIPRRILCTGFSIGGGLATIAALWAALTIPSADVCCVAFGAPRVGNIDFVSAFVNSVTAQFRVVYEADPTSHHPHPLFYAHAGHPIWIHDGKFLFQEERSLEQRQPDHDFEKYLQSVRAQVGVLPAWHAVGVDTVAGAVHDTLQDAVQGANHTVGDAMEGALSTMQSILPKAVGAYNRGTSARGVDDFEAHGEAASVVAPILDGKIAQATLLAWRAYEDEETFQKTTGLSNARLLFHTDLDTQVYVAWLEGGTAVFAFRGTESAQDAKADIDARSTAVPWMSDDYPDVRGHMGFMNQFNSVCDPEEPARHIGIALDAITGGVQPTRVLCCGHSLGGALATLAASWAAYEYPLADVRCITLGSPRVGNRVFCNAVKYLVGGMYRLVHGWDPVPTVPPPTGFKHVKGRMFLHHGQCKLCKRPWYMSYGLVCGRVGDHFVDPYAAHITHITGRVLDAGELGLIRPGAAADDDGDLTGLIPKPPAHANTKAAAHAVLPVVCTPPAPVHSVVPPIDTASVSQLAAAAASAPAASPVGGAYLHVPLVDMSGT